MKLSQNVDDLSNGVEQIQLTTEPKPRIERALSSSNKFKSTEESLTYSPSLAEISNLTLPPKPTHSLVIKLLEPSEVNNRPRLEFERFLLIAFASTGQSGVVSRP